MKATMEMNWFVSGSRNYNECMAIPLFISIIIALIKLCNEFLIEVGCVSVPQASVTSPNISRTAG